jgi:hypothetical protein
MVGEALAIGIATQLPDKFPSTVHVPATDTDTERGTAAPPGLELIVTFAAITLLAGAVLFAGTGRTARSRPRGG